jgi:site-specific DNA recombinase
MAKETPVTKSKTAAVIYARFSTDMQNDKSIDDQVAVCQKVARDEGLNVVETYSDRAKSSATLFDRDGLLEMMQAAKQHRFNVVIVECLDRLSRDPEDLPGLFKRLSFAGIQIRSADQAGPTTQIHIGVRSLVGSIFMTDLSNKVRRHHSGRVREGMIPGSLPYGYRFKPQKDHKGEIVLTHGGKIVRQPEIDPEQAKIVRRIYREYVAGVSPRAIALGLMKDGVPGPRGPHWNYQGLISSSSIERFGVLTNPMYIGRLAWNKNRTVTNPDSGKKTKRSSPENAFEVDLPHLRIIDQQLWDAAQATRAQRSRKTDHKVAASPYIARGRHMLAGLLRCGVCHGSMRTRGQSHGVPYVACGAAERHGSCKHTRNYNLDRMQVAVLDGMRERLANPKAVVEAVRAYHAEYAAQGKKNRSDAETLQRDVNRLQTKIDRIITAISDSDDPVPALVAKLKPLEAERASLAERLRLVKAETNVVELHPASIKHYQANIELLHAELSSGAVTEESKAAFRNLVDCIVVHPIDKGARYEFTPYARLGAVLGHMNLSPAKRPVKEMLAEQGVTGRYKDNSVVTDLSKQHQTVALGRWREEAA